MYKNTTGLNTSILQTVLEDVEKFKVDFTRFKSVKSFSELYESEETFLQIFIEERLEAVNTYTRVSFTSNLINRLELETSIVNYNLKLENAITAKINELRSQIYFDEREFRITNRVGVDIGYCNVHLFERNKVLEGSEIGLMYDNYNQTIGPYTRPFKDEESFAHFLEIIN